MGLVHRVAGALDFDGVTLGPGVVPPLEIGVDDLVVHRDDRPAGFCFPGGSGQWCAEHFRRGQHLRMRRRDCALAREIRCE